jgi:hypothetical protein
MIEVKDLRHVDADVAEAWLREIAKNLRQSDIDEVKASSSLSPEDALLASYHYSTHGYVILSNHPLCSGPIAAFGAAPHPLPGVGVVWMLGTDGIKREAYSVAKKTRHYFDELNAAYLMLWNYIDARNTVSMRWLRWGGFKLLAEHPDHGPEGRLFYTFARTNFDV